MNIGEVLDIWVHELTDTGIATARLDVLVLLEDALDKNRSWLLAHPEHPIQGRKLELLKQQMKRRGRHEPLAYIRGRSEFYGREFLVTPATLEPRPETEMMLDILKKIPEPDLIVDVGTGSGCIAISAALQCPAAQVYATEWNARALGIARQNAANHQVDITFYECDLIASVPFENVSQTTKLVIMANLPYVPDGHTINQAAMFEPKIAIFGGADGLKLYRRLFQQITALPEVENLLVMTESLPPQHGALTKVAQDAGFSLKMTRDFIQVFTPAI